MQIGRKNFSALHNNMYLWKENKILHKVGGAPFANFKIFWKMQCL